jgi:NADH:ubiquinone oxidoreductase subunit 6 (subunit J)
MIGCGILLLIFYLGLITVTLLVTNQVYNNDINQSMVKFVEVGNWIIVSILILFATVGIIVWKFKRVDLRLGSESESIHPASYS